MRGFAAVRELGDGEVGAAMAERLELAGCTRWRRRNEKWADELVGQARGGVHIVASSARASTACGHAVRWLAMSVTHASDVFLKPIRYCSINSVKPISLTARIDSV